MQILVALDLHPYSAHAVDEAARLAARTWAHVCLMGVQPNGDDSAMADRLVDLRARFLSHFDPQTCPYPIENPADNGFNEIRKGVYAIGTATDATPKTLTLRLRSGKTGREIVAEAREGKYDLIVLGCDAMRAGSWIGDPGVPRKVSQDAPCSVLVVKENAAVKGITCCLDHDQVSQASLEMINQMVTRHQAQLTLIGIAEHENLKATIAARMKRILTYYQERDIDPKIELVKPSALDRFVALEAERQLMAMWMGKPSLLGKVFPPAIIDTLIRGGDAPVLILR